MTISFHLAVTFLGVFCCCVLLVWVFFVPGFSFSSSQMGENCWKGLKGEAALSLAVALLTELVPCCSLLATIAPSALAGGTDRMGLAHPPFQSLPPRSWCILMAVSGSQDQGGI